MAQPDPNQLSIAPAERSIVDLAAARDAILNISGAWRERDWQHASHRNMVKVVEALADSDVSLNDHPGVTSHLNNTALAEARADDYTIQAEAEVAKAIGIPASVKRERSRGTIQKRIVANDPEDQAALDQAISTAWTRYGGEENTKRREDALRGRAPISFSPDSPVSERVREAQAHKLNPDKLIHTDGRTKRQLTPGALLGAQLLLKGFAIASAINVKEAAREQGITAQPELRHQKRTEYERLLSHHTLIELEAMENETLLSAAQYAEELRNAGLLPAVVVSNEPDQFLSEMQVEFHLPNTPERKRLAQALEKIVAKAMTPDYTPRSHRPGQGMFSI